jgi:glycerol-3-phosphate acyltransferase PlsY
VALLAIGLLFVVLAFLAGAVPFGPIVARLRGVDLRSVGSGNIGATNVARALGKRLALVVLLLDVAKGLGPTLAARLALPAGAEAASWIVGGAMLAAVLGHVFSPFLRFRGGKGVATALGVYLAASPLTGAIGLALYLALYAALRLSSLGSLAGSLAAAASLFLLGAPPPYCLAGVAIAVTVLATHRENIRRLLRGEERKV